MQVSFRATGAGAETDLRSLYRWLANDEALRGEAEIDKFGDQSVERMGPGIEMVLAVVSTAAALSQLPFSYLAWRQGHRPQTQIDISILVGDEAEAHAMLRRLAGEPATEPEEERPDSEEGRR